MRTIKNIRAASTIEYVMLLLIVLGALYVFQTYVSRSFNGRWKAAGDTFGMGRQYKPGKTAECSYVATNATDGFWYDANCYQAKVTTGCIPKMYTTDVALKKCEMDRKQECIANYCD